MLKELAEYAGDKAHKDFLLMLVSKDGKVGVREGCGTSHLAQSTFHTWVQDEHRTIIQLLEDLPSVRPPIDFLLELLPRLQCRYYSISSSAKVARACALCTRDSCPC
jgi:NADPH-ferrihemoprotein reductase